MFSNSGYYYSVLRLSFLILLLLHVITNDEDDVAYENLGVNIGSYLLCWFIWLFNVILELLFSRIKGDS